MNMNDTLKTIAQAFRETVRNLDHYRNDAEANIGNLRFILNDLSDRLEGACDDLDTTKTNVVVINDNFLAELNKILSEVCRQGVNMSTMGVDLTHWNSQEAVLKRVIKLYKSIGHDKGIYDKIAGALSGADKKWCPDFCPITRLPFFMWIEKEGIEVPTYGGPYDSYTIPEMDDKVNEPWHNRELHRYRYDHDQGCWIDGVESIQIRVINESVLFELEDKIKNSIPKSHVQPLLDALNEIGGNQPDDYRWQAIRAREALAKFKESFPHKGGD